jgi:hypothetical protein
MAPNSKPNPPFNTDPFRQAKVSLTRDISSLKEILQQKREHLQLIKEVKALEAELLTLSTSPESSKVIPKKQKSKTTLHAFPVTRSQGPLPVEETEENSDSQAQNQDPDSDQEASDSEDPRVIHLNKNTAALILNILKILNIWFNLRAG